MNGRITRQFTVWCFAERANGSTCSCWRQTDDAKDIRDAAKIFRSFGWFPHPDRGWLCPGCANENPEPSNPIAAARRHTNCG